jgi:dTMP kinase
VDLSGQFITFEGLDGSGKSTQLTRATEYLRARGLAVLATREPGGTELGQQIRQVLLHPSRDTVIHPLTELALMFAARAQHIEQVILPALRRGDLILCDRFTDSSVAYQGYGRGISLEVIRSLEQLLCQDVQPALTLLLDTDPATGEARTSQRNHGVGQPNTRFELEGLEFFTRVREGYLAIAREQPQRVKVIAAGGPIDDVWAAVRRELEGFLNLTPDLPQHSWPHRAPNGL